MPDALLTDEISPQRGTVEARIRVEALRLGFDVVGFARADVALGVEHARYLDFVHAGRFGEMRHLADHVDTRLRLDGEGILEGARSVVCLGLRYARRDEQDDPAVARLVARYARGRDYHRFAKKRLHKLAAFVASLAEGARARALCDIEPVLERAWAARSGLGFVGKNGLVITPGQGSYQLLGEVVTTLDLVAGEPLTERCGSCTRCLDACPTSAFVAPFVLDPRRCISYLTIEAKALPARELREGIGDHLFGCDVCQEVCPFNAGAGVARDDGDASPFRPSAALRVGSLAELVALGEGAWDEATLGTPLRRAKSEGVARNAVVVAWNRLRKDPDDSEARATLDAADRHESKVVRDVAVDARRDVFAHEFPSRDEPSDTDSAWPEE